MIIQNIVIEFAKKHPWLLLLNASFMIFVPFNEILLPFLYGKVVNAIQQMSGIEKALFLTVAAIIITQVGYVARDKLNEVFVPKFESFLKIEMVDKILDKYNNQFTNLTTGDIIYRLTVIPEILIIWFNWLNDFIIPYLVTFVVAIIMFFKFDIWIGLTFLTFVLVLVFLFKTAPSKCGDVSAQHNSRIAIFHEHIEEIINNMTTIYSTNSKNSEIKQLTESANHDYFGFYGKTSQCARKYKIFMIPVIALLITILVLRSKVLIQQKKIKSSAFVSIFFILTSMLGTIIWITEAIKYSVFDLGAIKNMDDVLNIGFNQIKPRHVLNSRPPNIDNEAIGLHNVNFAYNKVSIIKDLDIGFQKGALTVITGPVGKGKSTILKLLMGFYIPDSGDCFLGDKWYSEIGIDYVRNIIGYIPQQPVLFNNTVLYNVRYGNENRFSEDQVTSFIKIIGVDKRFKNGVMTQVGKAGSNISGGERQLLWCLRVMLQDPDILIMDEPTASMDDNTKELLFKIMDMLMKDKTVIFVSHDPWLVKKATRNFHMT